MGRTLHFLAPSLHPNTLVDFTFSEPGPSMLKKDPVVRHLAVKHGEHQPLGLVKRMIKNDEDHIVVADSSFQVSTIKVAPLEAPAPPEIVSQHTVAARTGDIWAGLARVQNGVISALSSGQLTYHSTSTLSRTVPSPLTTLGSTSASPNTFALAGKEVEVSVWDIERTFSETSNDVEMSGKRKKDVLESGEIWRARNLPNNSLSLRQPIYHLSLAYLPNSSTDIVTGTKAGTLRRYDTRQRKPVSNWKVAREGGVGCVQPGAEHEVFFSDRSSFLGSIDLRNGKLLYSYPKLTATAHHLFSIPPPSSSSNSKIGLASISSDATFRIHSTLPPPKEAGKGNTTGRKAAVEGILGGVGVGEGVFRGWGEEEDEEVPREEVDGEEDSEDEEEDLWGGMDEVVEGEESEDEDIPVKKVKKIAK